MKFLYFTDTHIKGTSPENRKDNYYETVKRKLCEIRSIIENYEIDYVLHGGDWFDRPDVSPNIVREIALIIRSFNRPVYSVAGNHDMFGQNPETIGRTMVGLLDGAGVIELLRQNENIILEKEGIQVQLTGSSFSYEIDSEKYRDYYIIKKQKGAKYCINIVHGMLLEKPFFEGIQHTLISNIQQTEADVTMSGHYHSGFGIKKIGPKYFINPGSMVRVINTLSEMKRRPKVILIEMINEVKVSELGLESAPAGEEVLDRSKLVLAYDRSMKLKEFYDRVTAAEQYKTVNLNSIVQGIRSNRELSTEVRDEAINRIFTAKEQISSEGDEAE